MGGWSDGDVAYLFARAESFGVMRHLVLPKFLPVIQPEFKLWSILPILRHNLQVRDVHIKAKLALPPLTVLRRAMVASIADRVSAGIRLATRKASCQIPKSIQLLRIKSSFMPRHTAIVWAFTAKVIVVTEFLMSKPRVDRFHGFDVRIDSFSMTIPVNDWFWPANMRPMQDITENALEIALSKLWKYTIQVLCASRILEYHQLLRGRTIVLQYFGDFFINDAPKKE